MSSELAGVLQLLALMAALALVHRPLGDHMARVYSSGRHLRVEKWIYKGIGANPSAEMRWPAYLRGVLAFSAVGVLFLYLLQRVQGSLPGSLGFASIDPDQAFNTAASFVSNTNWQSYYGEQAMGHVVQTGGLAVQNFVSAAVGMAVAVALVRGFARSRTGELGNFWADLVRGVVRILLPLAAVGAIVLVACGASRTSPVSTRWASSPAAASSGTAVPSPRRKRSRNSAPTAAATSTPTPRIPSRTPTRSRTSSRSS